MQMLGGGGGAQKSIENTVITTIRRHKNVPSLLIQGCKFTRKTLQSLADEKE